MKNPSLVIMLSLLVSSVGFITYLVMIQSTEKSLEEDPQEQAIRKQIKENSNIGRIMLITPIPSPCTDETVYKDIQTAIESGDPERICTFDLQSKNLAEFPPEINIFKNLSTIGLRNNGLTKFPSGLFSLTHLTRIGLMENKISTIPKEIKALKNLQVLNLGSNKLSTLPDEFGELSNLEHLILDNNSFTTLPQSVYKLKKLKTLSLIDNPIDKDEKEKIKKSFPNTKVLFEL